MSTNFDLNGHSKRMMDVFKEGKTLADLANEQPKETGEAKDLSKPICPECFEEKTQRELDDFGGLCEECMTLPM